MRLIAAAFAVLATPAFAHHEVVVAASLLPMLSGVIAITVASLTAWRGRTPGK